MNLSIDEQKRMLKKVRADSKHLTLAERWQEEDKMNRQLGVYRKTKQSLPKARRVNKKEFDRILENLNKVK